MATCGICGGEDYRIPSSLSVCPACLKSGGEEAMGRAAEVHRRGRLQFSLPPEPPRTADAPVCNVCVNRCRIGDGEYGYCGIRTAEEGRIVELAGTPERGNLEWYYDPLPTNCVADWVCAGGSGAGYPRYARSDGPESGCKNLAVFYNACSFDCLFCQNWQYRSRTLRSSFLSASELASLVDDKTSCVCFFGGDPTPQVRHALAAAKEAVRRTDILRICWETNGSVDGRYLERMAKLSLDSGGCIKFDLKAWTESVHIGLTGVTNERTLANFRYCAGMVKKRPEPPFLIASTLLVPGYVDTDEVARTAEFIASLDPDIPYALLAFHPQFYFDDVRPTSRREAEEALGAARGAGLRNVRLGNIHLLW